MSPQKNMIATPTKKNDRPVRRTALALLSLTLLGTALPTQGRGSHDSIAQLEFRDISVGDALRILSEQSQLNIIASEEAAKIKMTMYLRDIRPMDVLQAMAKTYNLWYQQDPSSGVVRVFTVKEFRLGQVDYKNEQTEIFTFKHQRNALDFAYTVYDLFGLRVRMSRGADENEITNELSSRLQRFDMIARNTMDVGRTGGDFGISSGSSGGGFNNGFGGGVGNNGFNNGGFGGGFNNQAGGGQYGNQYGGGFGNRFGGGRFGNQAGGQFGARGQGRQGQPYVLQDNQILNAQDVLPETEAQAAFSGDYAGGARAMSELIQNLSPIYVTIIRPQNRVLVRTRDREAMDEIAHLAEKLDTELATLLLEVKVLKVDLSDGFDSVFDFSVDAGDLNITKGDPNFAGLPNPTVVPGARTGEDGFAETGDILTKLTPQIANALAIPTMGNSALVATLISSKFRARLQLLEEEGRITQLATPMLLTTNQEVSRIFIGEERPITEDIRVVCSTVGNNADVASSSLCRDDPVTNLRPIGRTMLLTPNINADGTVSVRILIEESDVCRQCGEIPTEFGNRKVDTVNTQTFGGNVVARNQEAVAVGGLINESARDNERKVPLLGDIPLIGALFTDQHRSRGRSELVILLKPYIMNSPSEIKDVHQAWLEKHSVHPDAGIDTYHDVYTNPPREHRGYELEPQYRMYRGQDSLDRHRWNDWRRDRPAEDQTSVEPGAQQVYMELTRHAAQMVRKPQAERSNPPSIRDNPPPALRRVALFADERISAFPVASWRRGGINVTAVALRNVSSETVMVDHTRVKGDWLAATIEEERLAPRGQLGDSTYLYLISAETFDDIAQR